jgi:hypothetical protein
VRSPHIRQALMQDFLNKGDESPEQGWVTEELEE